MSSKSHRRSSMSSREEDQILDDYRKQFEKKSKRRERSKERNYPVSPYLQSVAPRNVSTFYKRPHSAIGKVSKPHAHFSKDKPTLVISQSYEDDSSDKYSSEFDSSESEDSNEKENHMTHDMKPLKPILRNRPMSAPMHKRRHTHEGSVYARSVSSEKNKTVPVFQRQPTTIRCTAFRNGSRENPETLVAADVKQLLIDATRKLGLNTAARRVYLEDGSEAFRAKDISFNADVFISCGEQFRDPKKVLNDSGGLVSSSSWTMKGVVLESDRKPVRRTMTNRLRRLAGKQSSRILVFLNGDGADGQDVIFGNQDKYNRLLSLSTSKLKMNSAARTTYGWDGKQVSSLEEIRELDSCMKSGSSLILGPIWVSAGEGFSPTGALNFVEGILWGLNQRLRRAKIRSEQLDYACDGEMTKVTHTDLVTMSTDDIYENIEQVSNEVEEMKKAKKKYKERQKILKDMKKNQISVGSTYTMKHIKEIKSDDRIVGMHGLRLKIFENGKDQNAQTVYINMREITRGTEKLDEPEGTKLVRTRFLENLSHWHKPTDPTGPAKSSMVRRMFDKDGEEILNIDDLKNEQEIYLSYGEDFKPPFVMSLQIQLVPVRAFESENEGKVVIKKEGEIEKGVFNTKWSAHNGFPDDYNFFKIESIGKKSETFSIDDHYLQSKNDPSVIVKPILTGEKKPEKKLPMGLTQSWLVHRNGLITSRNYPQLALALDDNQPITVKMSCGAEVTGYALTIQKREQGNSRQQWEFNPSGQICSLYSPSNTQVLTTLNPDHFSSVSSSGQTTSIGNQTDQDQTVPNQQQADESMKIVALEKLTGHRAKFQRWALKQESVQNQWKHTKVANPAWKKLAYSWPVLPDGNWNMQYKWPMEGFFLNSPPHLKRQAAKHDEIGTVPLKVYRNGEKDRKRFVTVVVPDLSATSLANEKNEDDAKAYVIKLEMNMFLERATSLLNLSFAARRIFNAHGREIYSLRKVKRDQEVFVTCGETWHDPAVSKTEAQRRQLLAKLTSDVKKINDYCILRDAGNVVVAMESGPVLGSRLVITQRVEVPKKSTDIEQENEKKESKDQENEQTDELITNLKSYHEKSHEFSDNWMMSRKYSWQQEKHFEEETANEIKKSPRTPRLAQRSPRPWLKDPILLQKFEFKDGFITPKFDSKLAVGIPGLDLDNFSGVAEVKLCDKDKDDMTQKWDVRSDGTIRLICDHSAGLAVCLPAITANEEPSPKNYAVVLQKLKPYAVGSSNQRWKFDSDMLKAFHSSVVDKEVTAANHVSVCTYTVRGPEPLNQEGFIVEVQGSTPNNPFVVCRPCATVLRGKFSLTKAPVNWSFICTMGTAKKRGLKQYGSFRCLNEKVDLSTYEAEPTLKHWVAQLRRLEQETSVRSINRDINNVECTQAWRLLIRRNGEGYHSKPEMVVGSSVTGILDQCSHKLGLSSAARRLYTEDGTQILHMDQLKQWIQKAGKNSRKLSVVQTPEGNTDSENKEESTETTKTDKSNNDGANSTEGTPDHSTAEYGTQDLTRKTKKSKQSTNTVENSGDTFIQDISSLPIVEVWVSCGENFINPTLADKMTQESLATHTERNAKNLEADTQRHVIRQLHGRRRGHLDPAELVPTRDTKQPVVVTGGWTETTKEEGERILILNKMKESNKPKRPRSALKLRSGIYEQPQMKRITVRAIDDQATSVYAWGNSFEALLDDASSRLGLRRIVRLFYTPDGQKIRNYDGIERNAELFLYPKRAGSTIKMKTVWARTRKVQGREATEIVLNSPTSETNLSYVPPTNVILDKRRSSSSSSNSSSSSSSDSTM